MHLFPELSDFVSVKLTGADIPASLSALSKHNVRISEICRIDDVTVRFTILGKDLNRARSLALRRGDHLVITKRTGMFRTLRSLLHRPVLVIGLAFLLMLGAVLQGRVLFVSVEGNDRIPSRMIMESAEHCGIHFWASRRTVRSEKMKNMLLKELPELKWAGVNTYGCRAVITVRERNDPPTEKTSSPVSHIAATRDGIITSCTTSKGTALCQTGQAVKTGDILISGYTDCGISIISSRAAGEVFADTRRDLNVVMPSTCRLRSQFPQNKVRYSLLIGKKRINFYKGSGISGATCVKMLTEYVLTLPGGFDLPVSVIKETVTECTMSVRTISEPDRLLQSFAEDYLKHQMIAGTIIHKAEQITEGNGIVTLTGRYICSESIGKSLEEKIGEEHGKTSGTDRERGSGG